jgi:hypothetical protein
LSGVGTSNRRYSPSPSPRKRGRPPRRPRQAAPAAARGRDPAAGSKPVAEAVVSSRAAARATAAGPDLAARAVPPPAEVLRVLPSRWLPGRALQPGRRCHLDTGAVPRRQRGDGHRVGAFRPGANRQGGDDTQADAPTALSAVPPRTWFSGDRAFLRIGRGHRVGRGQTGTIMSGTPPVACSFSFRSLSTPPATR